MLYKITLSDKSFFIVDDTYILTIFKKFDFNTKIEVPITENVNTEEYIFLDNKDNLLIPLFFAIETTDNIENYPLNTRLKNVQDVQINDLVIGPDKLPRRVVGLHKGEDEMYKIKTSSGKSVTVNGGHILHLIDKKKNIVQVKVRDYIQYYDRYKHLKMLENND